MEVTPLCIRLLMTVLMLLVAHVQTHEAAFRIVPNRLQLFEYESVQFTCLGFNVSAGCKVRNIKRFIPSCSNGTVTTAVSCTIVIAYVSDGGEYWCEGGGGERSNTVNITVTAGSVILESPVLPMMEGEAATLSCRNKVPSIYITANFYKDGLHIRTSYTGNMTIHNVSKSDEGLYKCSISGAGESPESRLTVRTCNKGEADFFKDGCLIRNSSTGETTIHSNSKYDKGLYKCNVFGAGESTKSCRALRASFYHILLWIVISVVLVLQLLVMGLLCWKKQLILLEAKLNDPNNAGVKKVKKKKKVKDAADAADNLSLCFDTNHSTNPQREMEMDEHLPQSSHSTFNTAGTSHALQNESGASSFTVTAAPSAATDPHLADQEPLYASIEEITEKETPY